MNRGEDATPSGRAALARIPTLVCAFRVGARCYAVDVSLVSEVVPVEQLAPVPHAPPAVLGLFSLRGTPLALLDPVRLLELPDEDGAAGDGGARLGLLIKPGKVPLGALRVTRVEAIVGVAPERYRTREAGGEHPAVQGFVTLGHQDGLVATVLNTDVVMQRILWLKPRAR